MPLHRLPALLSAAKEVREQGTFGYIDTSLATPGGRVGIDGSEIETLDEAGAAQAFAEARAAGISACAILLMHAAPFGLAGGADGALGRQWVERRDGSRHVMTGTGPNWRRAICLSSRRRAAAVTVPRADDHRRDAPTPADAPTSNENLGSH